MKRLLRIALTNDIFRNESLPEPSNKRFYLRKATIRNYMIKETTNERNDDDVVT